MKLFYFGDSNELHPARAFLSVENDNKFFPIALTMTLQLSQIVHNRVNNDILAQVLKVSTFMHEKRHQCQRGENTETLKAFRTSVQEDGKFIVW